VIAVKVRAKEATAGADIAVKFNHPTFDLLHQQPMYERYYGFREKPFSLLPDPAFLHLGSQHSKAYALLEYGVLNRAGFTVLTGEIGCGKTALIRHLLNALDEDVTVGLLSNTHSRFNDLLEWVLMAFGLDYVSKQPVRNYDVFVEFLISEYARNRRVVLIVDEAQNLSAAALEELRTLSNINADKDQVLQLILVGQSELRTTLSQPGLRQLAQRVSAHYHLEPLDAQDTVRYIRHRLDHAGGSTDLFSHEACRLIHRKSRGVPRLINLLCDTALVYGFAENAEVIDENLVQEVINERAAGMNVDLRDQRPAQRAQPMVPASDPAPVPSKDKSADKRDRVVEFDRSEARQLFSHLLKRDS
jgi:type II secretory pathway predicted ATPase ExeA